MKTIRFSGFLATAVYLGLTLTAFLFCPEKYSPLHNWLSDLGNPLINTKGAVFYNAGCLIAGLLLIVFYLGLKTWRTGDKVLKRLLAIAQIAGVCASAALILAAVFNIGEHFEVHSRFSMILVIGLTWFLSFVNTALLRHPRFWKWLAFYGFVAAAVSLIYGVFLNAPIGEWATIGMFIAYIVLLSCNALSAASMPATKQVGASL